VRPLRKRVEEISDDPKKLKRVFTFIWVTAYLMLILGFLLIVWVFFFQTT
jgi:cell division septal protein FtsQ